MTADTVTAADLAAALREALPYVVDLADYVREASEEGYRDSWEADSTLESVRRWQAILDRYDAQLRDKAIQAIGALERAKSWDMNRAREESGDDRLWRVEQAREANWSIVRFRCQLRELGGDA